MADRQADAFTPALHGDFVETPDDQSVLTKKAIGDSALSAMTSMPDQGDLCALLAPLHLTVMFGLLRMEVRQKSSPSLTLTQGVQNPV